MNHNLYEEDKIKMDFQINKYTLKCLRAMLFAILGIWLLNVLHIFVVNQKLMSTGVSITSCILIVVLTVIELICFFQVCSGKAKEPAIIRSLNFLK